MTGSQTEVPVLGGTTKRYIFLDNGASTPVLEDVRTTVDKFMSYYGSVHRGSGFKSQLSSWLLDEARATVLNFAGADPTSYTAVFTKNATESLNRLSQLFAFEPGDVVLISAMEHHSNDLPWRARAAVDHVAVTALGELDMDDLRAKLRKHGSKVRLVSITGASNVTGFVNPIHEIARLAHAHGALIAVDAAQLAPHRKIHMAGTDEASRIDFLAISAHKMYAPYGSGALIAPIAFLEQADPDMRGGGAVRVVTRDEVYLSPAPDRVEPGSPNTVGAIAMSRAMKILDRLGMDQVDQHERQLTTYALNLLREVPGLKLYGSTDPARTADRLGVIPINMGDMPHELLAAILSYESGIGVRAGCFCAHPYVIELLGYDAAHVAQMRDRILSGDRTGVPGMVRVSFGVYNSKADVDALVAALHRVARGEYAPGYVEDVHSGRFSHPGYQPDFTQYFTLDD